MKTITVTIIDPAGMHTRPASIISKKAAEYTADINIEYSNKKMNMKSIIGVMSLGITTQSQINISFDGIDEEIASEKIINCLKENQLI